MVTGGHISLQTTCLTKKRRNRVTANYGQGQCYFETDTYNNDDSQNKNALGILDSVTIGGGGGPTLPTSYENNTTFKKPSQIHHQQVYYHTQPRPLMTSSDGGGGLAGRSSYENNNEEERKSLDRIRKSLIDIPGFNTDRKHVTPPTANAGNKQFQTPASNTVAGYSNINRMDTSSSKGAQ